MNASFNITDLLDDKIPWRHIVHLIPFSQQIFITGSAATWMAEFVMFETEPLWQPGDIDVFVLHPEPMFATLVTAFAARHSHMIQNVKYSHRNVVDIEFDSSKISGPKLSFVRCQSGANERDVIQQFDIDVCKAVINRYDGILKVSMTNDVLASIREREMHCIVRKMTPLSLMYPLQRNMNRIRKYMSRGYKFMTIKFESSCPRDFPDHACELHPNDFSSSYTANA